MNKKVFIQNVPRLQGRGMTRQRTMSMEDYDHPGTRRFSINSIPTLDCSQHRKNSNATIDLTQRKNSSDGTHRKNSNATADH